MLDFFSNALLSGRIAAVSPVEISMASYKDLHPHCVDYVIEVPNLDVDAVKTTNYSGLNGMWTLLRLKSMFALLDL